MVKINGVTFNTRDVAETLVRSFTFLHSPQGHRYWMSIVKRLGGGYDWNSPEEEHYDDKIGKTGLSIEELFPQIMEPFLSEKEFKEYMENLNV